MGHLAMLSTIAGAANRSTPFSPFPNESKTGTGFLGSNGFIF
jgi:hypothetical protein